MAVRAGASANPASRVAILGASGMLGRKLAQRLNSEPTLAGTPVAAVTLVDTIPFGLAQPSFETEIIVGDIGDPEVLRSILAAAPEIIFHLAAVVSAEAEADFDKGYRVNVEGLRTLLEAIRAMDAYCPRLVFASSLAVFGGPLPEVIPDYQETTPQTSYGMEKVVGELLLSEYTRRGFLDAVSIRLPTVCVRPGRPNKAASSFFSSIIREPLNGQRAALPVTDDVRHWFASPRAAVDFLLHAAQLDSERLGDSRSLNMPGVSATVGDQIAALRRAAGDRAVDLIERRPDPRIQRIIDSWPRSFSADRALALGFGAEHSFDELVRVYIEDELEGSA